MTVTATEARQNFFQALKLVEQGEEVIILRENKDQTRTTCTITKVEAEQA
jgi:PHD/YefM family antitoxin component YafN of YafNO toxin-antitoxin module